MFIQGYVCDIVWQKIGNNTRQKGSKMFEEVDQILQNRENNFPNDLIKAKDLLQNLLGEEQDQSQES